MRRGSDDGTLGPALLRAVLGPNRGGPLTSIPRMVGFLERRHGAKLPPGLKEHTWRRMRKDPTRATTEGTREAIRAAYAAARLSQGREARLRRPENRPVFRGKMAISDEPPRDRTLDLGTWPDDEMEDVIGDVIDAYQGGDVDDMADAFAEPLEDVVGAAIHFSSVQSVMFE